MCASEFSQPLVRLFGVEGDVHLSGEVLLLRCILLVFRIL